MIAELIGEQYMGKEKLLAPNVQAMSLGRKYVFNNLDHPLGITVKRANAIGERIFIEGNSAAALGCVYGGATVAAWYPITPSSSLAEAFARHCRKFRTDPASGKSRYAIIQAEDELASIGIVDRRRVERRSLVHRDFGSRHFADAGIHRARVFRGDTGGAVRHSARQPVDRHADAHAAGRPDLLRVRVAR